MVHKYRPQLTPVQAADYAPEIVLGKTGRAGNERDDPWHPWDDAFMAGHQMVTPKYIATPDVGLAEVINRAVTECAGAERIYIGLEPGVYEGPVYVPSLRWNGQSVPFTLFGVHPDPAKTVICADIDAEMPGDEYHQRFSERFRDHHVSIRAIFDRIAGKDKITTANASVLRIENDDCQLRHLTLKNTYNADRLPADDETGKTRAAFQQSTGQHQAVALLVAGADRVHCENLNLESYQDTLYLKSPAPFTTVRSYFRGCKIAGDVDFIFGQTTAYFTACTIVSRGSRALHSWVAAPSTNIRTPFGFVFDHCTFAHDNSDNAHAGRFSLGRQWFEAVRATPYGTPTVPGYQCIIAEQSEYTPPTGTISRATLEAVGKCVILRSGIGRHINPAAPWDDWNGGQFDRDGNYEPGPWNARFRPVQLTCADLFRHLDGWLAEQDVDLSDIPPETVLLAEFENYDI
ncbi:pectinesterase family protein [Loktanella sp. S4079]|uniref:pectinesterase family protein n=1 Tax=Loktanella sp. S4079 TaxID=579483 RepID=UPI0006960FD1|nr:pectinesterase family protein [Loktanella sp. S4079]